MSWELHYTSAPRGLRPGSRGFCVVAETPNLSIPLRERLEGLSGYQQVFPPHDPRAGLNPVILAHHRLSLGGRTLSILSRVAFAGLDYTDRANKYAHHLVIEPSERPAGGPAWLLGRPGVMDQTWRGEPRMLAAGRAVPRGDSSAGVASAWRSATGDAGWAGALAEAFLNNPSRPAYLIYEPGFDPLPLFAEALALLPPSQRWNVDFNTYFTTAPQGLTCAWRGVLAGAPAAARALKTPGALVLDLSRPMGSPGDGPLIQQARTGHRPAPAEAPRARPTRAEAIAPSRSAAAAAEDDIPTIELIPEPPPPPRSRWGIDLTERPRTPAASRSRFHAARWLVAIAMILLLAIGGGWLFLVLGEKSGTDALIDDAAVLVRQAREKQPPPKAEPENPAEPSKPNEKQASSETPKDSAPAAAPGENNAAVVANQKPSEPAEPDFVYRPLFVDLPAMPKKTGIGDAEAPGPAALPIHAEPSTITLHQFPGGAPPKLKLRESAAGAAKTWTIGPNDDEDRKSLAYTPYFIAQLKFEGGRLIISWDQSWIAKGGSPELVEALRDCVLDLGEGQGRDGRFVVLRKLVPVKVAIELTRPGSSDKYDAQLLAAWATGPNLGGSRWELEARRHRIDATDAKGQSRILSEGENADSKPRAEFEIVPKAVFLELKPAEPANPDPKAGERDADQGRLSITLKKRDQYLKDREEMKKLEEQIKQLQAKIDAGKATDEDKKSKAEAETNKKDLEPKVQKYDLIEQNKSARLSLILGLRLKDGTFLDLARIGEFAKTNQQQSGR